MTVRFRSSNIEPVAIVNGPFTGIIATTCLRTYPSLRTCLCVQKKCTMVLLFLRMFSRGRTSSLILKTCVPSAGVTEGGSVLAEPKGSRMSHLEGGGTLRAGAVGASATDNDGSEMRAGRKEIKRLGDSGPEQELVGELYSGESNRTTCLNTVLWVQLMGDVAVVRNAGRNPMTYSIPWHTPTNMVAICWLISLFGTSSGTERGMRCPDATAQNNVCKNSSPTYIKETPTIRT